jgi:Cu/Ag efflux protein CusF
VVTVPVSAVIDSGTRQIVLIQQGEGRFEPREVKLGAAATTHVEVIEGVKDGEQVVVAANFLIDAESNLKAAVGGFGTPPTAPPQGGKRQQRTAAAAKGASHQAEGTVDSVDAKAGTISLNHGPVASLKWPAMTMEFKVANASLLQGLKPGAKSPSSSSSAARRMGDHGRQAAASKPGSRHAGRRPTRTPVTDREPRRVAMLAKIIEWSGRNRFLVLLATLFITIGGIFAVLRTPIDALPDLSDVQVIVYTEYPGQAPQVVEDQVTYPLTTAMLSVPKSKVVRGFSFFGASFVYIIFEDGTDIYWARSRVLEYLNFASSRMPKGVTPSLGPDATGVGWVYQYALLAKDKTLAELRTIQDWYVRYQLTKAHGVAEVASIGGFVQTYQVTVDPVKLRAYGIPLMKVAQVIRDSNRDVGGRVVEMAETEYMVRGKGYLRGKSDIECWSSRATRARRC